MQVTTNSVLSLKDSILEGSFPDSDETLSSNLTADGIPALLISIASARKSLSDEIESVSKSQAHDVDKWIAEAKKVQDDIARCKTEAKQIVKEHERLESMRNAIQDQRNKVQLLEAEITFNQSLQHELRAVAEISQVLKDARSDLRQDRSIGAVQNLMSATVSIGKISVSSTRGLLEQLVKNLRQDSIALLERQLHEIWQVGQDSSSVWIETTPEKPTMSGKSQNPSLEALFNAFQQVEASARSLSLVSSKVELLLLPLFGKRSTLFAQSVTVNRGRLSLLVSDTKPDISTTIGVFESIVNFLRSTLSVSIYDDVAKQLLPKLISSLIDVWLNVAIPYELDELNRLEKLQEQVSDLVSKLNSVQGYGQEKLKDWLEQIPRTWLSKRRTKSLDAVREAFAKATGSTRLVERIERQLIQKEDQEIIETTEDEDDWNANWDDEPQEETPAKEKLIEEDEEMDGWGFETGSNESDPDDVKQKQDAMKDSDKAWGWADDSSSADKVHDLPENSPIQSTKKVQPEPEEIVLTEEYAITDVPDYILEVISKDILDATTLNDAGGKAYFTSTAPVAALQALPTLVLAMFRATASTYYSHSRSLTNINLYNDALYITEVIKGNPDPQLQASVKSALEAMAKFARQTYTRELDTQRTILSDLLDGAQGFVAVNTDQYREISSSAVSAVVDRIRQLYTEYRGVLGQSHLLQIISLLITMVMGKVIHDIEDLEDISEKESERLVEYCQQISSLEDLFMAAPPPTTIPQLSGEGKAPQEDSQQPISLIARYVPNYLRFQYLSEILQSSLADIKYMWTEGELKLEFGADEIVDLIKALFAESNHRRSAISAIRSSA